MAKSQTQPQAQTEEWGEEISGGALITWNEPRVLIGTLIDLVEVQGGKYGDKYKATLVTDDGETVATFPPSMLLTRLQQVPLRTRVRIEYNGTTVKSKSGRDVKEFSVRTSNSPSIEQLARAPLAGTTQTPEIPA
jgi:hypothetical protein